jgi:hypothetical protein
VINGSLGRGTSLAILLFIVGILLITVLASVANAAPEGVFSVAIRNSERRTANASVNVSAQGGNITRLNISINTQTGSWQGFAGNISGNIVLDDATGDHFYTWSLFNVSGEIYASRNTSLNFNNIYPTTNCSVDQALTGGGGDRINRTYIQNFNTRNFSVGTIAINSSSSCTVRPYVNGSNQTSTNLYENIILNAETNNESMFNVTINNTIYAGILEPDGTTGFDGQQYNFQLLVPVNKTAQFNTYAFYAELD